MTVPLSSRRLVVVAFNIFQYSGHFFNEVFGYGAAARAVGIGPEIYLNATAPSRVVEHLGATALLPDVPLNIGDRDAFIDEISRVLQGLQPLWEALERSGISDRDIVAVTSPRPLAIYAFGLWLSRLQPAKRPAVFFRFSPHHVFDFAANDFPESSWTYRFAARVIEGLPGGERIHFAADSKFGARLVETLCKRAAHPLGLPKHYGDSGVRAEPGDKTTMYVHCSRGGLMPQRSVDIIRTILGRRSDITIRLRICKHVSPSPELNASIERGLSGLDVELLPCEQTPDEFLDVIENSDVVLLPYDVKEYRGIISGPFCEAAAKGKINIVADGTWMADEIAEGRAAGITFADTEPGCVADAIERAIRGRSELLARAARLAGTMRATNSCEGCLGRMIELSASPQDIRLPYLPEQRLISGAGGRHNLGPGWSQIEAGFGVWSDGERAGLHFNVRPSRDSLVFTAEVHPFIADSHPNLGVVFSVEGKILSAWNFHLSNDTDTGWSRRSLQIPPDLVGSGNFKLVLDIKAPVSPLELGQSTDHRKLGIAMRSYALSPANSHPI